MNTAELFFPKQKVAYGLSANTNDANYTCLIKQTKDNLLAIIISNKDKNAVQPDAGEELFLFPEIDGTSYAVVATVVKNQSHPQLVIKIPETAMPVRPGDTASSATTTTIDIDLDMLGSEHIALPDISDDDDPATILLPADDGDMDLSDMEEDDNGRGDLVLPDEEDEEPSLAPPGSEDDDSGGFSINSNDERDADGALSIDMSDMDDEGEPTLSIDTGEEDEDDGAISIEMVDDDDEDLMAITSVGDTEGNNGNDLPSPLSDVSDADEDDGAFSIEAVADDDDELPEFPSAGHDDNTPSTSSGQSEGEHGAAAWAQAELTAEVDEQDEHEVEVEEVDDHHEDEAIEADSMLHDDELEGEGELDDDDPATVPPMDDTLAIADIAANTTPGSADDIEVALGDMMGNGDDDEEGPGANTRFQQQVPMPPPDDDENGHHRTFRDFFPVSIEELDASDASRIGAMVERGMFDEEPTDHSEQTVDLAVLDPDVRAVFAAVTRKISRLESLVRQSRPTGIANNGVMVELHRDRVRIAVPTPLPGRSDVLIRINRPWSPTLTFAAVGKVVSCLTGKPYSIATIGLNHLSPDAVDSIDDYFDKGEEFYQRLIKLTDDAKKDEE